MKNKKRNVVVNEQLLHQLYEDKKNLKQQLQEKDKVIEAAIEWRKFTQTIQFDECCPDEEKCSECKLVKIIDDYKEEIK